MTADDSVTADGIGAESLQGGDGDDSRRGDRPAGEGRDGFIVLPSQPENDTIFGKVGDDPVFGNAGADLTGGDAGNERINTSPGSDAALSGIGAESLQGGDGKRQPGRLGR
ncbi:hypothetical protein [Cognatishimia sp. F0-27]|uniref:hypothetical protein n=1 Tax=Cognatishimia sp. F0-27 TaxID=2816855 RepID=UPI001D0BFA52|nr:hypothetical protein [Cognatishimia sp. F0-27]MCC1494748.1 hypothetical protein [Cognatishimia sp. F0-27]